VRGWLTLFLIIVSIATSSAQDRSGFLPVPAGTPTVPSGDASGPENGPAAVEAPQPSVKGSDQIVRWQNLLVDAEGLPRIADRAMFEAMIASGELVPITPCEHLVIDPRLDPAYRYGLPRLVDLLHSFAAAFREEFGRPIQVNSAARDVPKQRGLGKIKAVRNKRGKKVLVGNFNAAAWEGPKASLHLTGAAGDISWVRMTKKEREFTKNWFLPLMEAQLAWLTEETGSQHVWHVTVLRGWAEAMAQGQR